MAFGGSWDLTTMANGNINYVYSSGSTWIQPHQMTYPPSYPNAGPTPQEWQQAIDEQAARVRQQRERQDMRGLFEVFMVDPKTDDVRLHVYVIAADETRARLKAAQRGFKDSLLTAMDDLDDLDVIVRHLGDIRAK